MRNLVCSKRPCLRAKGSLCKKVGKGFEGQEIGKPIVRDDACTCIKDLGSSEKLRAVKHCSEERLREQTIKAWTVPGGNLARSDTSCVCSLTAEIVLSSGFS